MQGIVPRVIVTDKLRSYGVAEREIIPSVERSSHKSLNTRAENSHPPLPRTERILHRFKSTRHQMTSSDFRDLRHSAI
ncbi:DDE domain protein [Ochrobactrum quorumnocens]|uniref:DDE domain protein n=1 Tax=Ochrobactrum quorumnocens TaxID=271865 RepID=A0A248UC21_9HYPH|nr:DDE domain protein [[Ochrobactrum] quorumnocens]